MGLINRVGQLAVAKVRQRTEIVRSRHSSVMGPGVILAYSGVSKDQIPSFCAQLDWLHEHAVVQPLSALARSPEAMTDRPRVSLAFLGAFDSVHRNAIPKLEERRLGATVFAVSDFLGRAPSWDMPANDPARHEIGMSVGQLSSLRRDLFEVGSLTTTHPRLDRKPPATVRAELLNSMNDLAAALARPVTMLATPYGACNDEIARIAAEVGYEIVVAGSHAANPDNPRPIVMQSVNCSPDDWISEFEHKVHGRYMRRSRRARRAVACEA